MMQMNSPHYSDTHQSLMPLLTPMQQNSTLSLNDSLHKIEGSAASGSRPQNNDISRGNTLMAQPFIAYNADLDI